MPRFQHKDRRALSDEGRRDRHGFTIVEVLIGVALFAVIITSLAASSLYSARTLTSARMRLEATHYLQRELEYLNSLPWDSLDSGSRTSAVGKSEWMAPDSVAFKRIILRVEYSPTGGNTVKDSIVAYRMAP